MWRNDAPPQTQIPQPTGASSQGHAIPQLQAITFRLTLPVTRLGIGLFSFDPLEQVLGAPVESLLRGKMTGPSFQRPSSSGVAVNCYPLAILPGDGIALNLQQWGELGMANDNGYLRLSVPLLATDWVWPRLAPLLVRGPEQGLNATRTARVALFWLQLRPGLRACVPIPMLGEVGLETGEG